MAEEGLQLILEKVRSGKDPSCYELWACRGEGRGCPRNRYREKKAHCEDCVKADPAETIGHLQDRMKRGDS